VLAGLDHPILVAVDELEGETLAEEHLEEVEQVAHAGLKISKIAERGKRRKADLDTRGKRGVTSRWGREIDDMAPKKKPRSGGLVVGPMGSDLLLWRCLHGGPLSLQTIDTPAPLARIDWQSVRARNVPLLQKLVETYGSCAIVAWDGAEVVGTLRFYPKALCEFGPGGAAFCLQQPHPAGPRDDRGAGPFPPQEALTDGTLFVHCLFVVSPWDEPDRYRRKGLATRLVLELVRWGRERGWLTIEANAYEEIPMLYARAGVAGRRFWEKIGFRCVQADTEPGMTGEILEAIRKDAAAAGIPPERAANRFRMRLELNAP
jgi:hypothetical protein